MTTAEVLKQCREALEYNGFLHWQETELRTKALRAITEWEAAGGDTAAAWQALAEKRADVIGTFLADIVNCHPDYCDHDSNNPGVCLRDMRERHYLDLSAALSVTPADALAARDERMRALGASSPASSRPAT